MRKFLVLARCLCLLCVCFVLRLGGWHILRDWNMYSWDYKRVLKRLHSEYGVTPFFKITVEPNPRWPANNSIRISPSGIGLPEREFYYADPEDKLSTAYKRLLRDIVSKLRATSNDAIKFSTDLFYYEKRIAEITPDSIFLRNPINTHNIITVSELKITAASLPLRDILVSMFPNAGITDETEILVSSPDYLTAVSGIVSNSDRSSLNDYLIWCLVKEYLPFLSTEYTAEFQQYISELTGVHAPIERWETCIKIVKKFMGVAVHALLENNVPLTQESSKIVKNMFNNLRNAALQHINEQNFPSEYRRHIIQKTTGLAIKIGFPKNVSTDEYLVNYYLKLYVQKSNLFQNVWNGFTFLRNEQQQRYLEPQSEYRLIRFSTSQSFNVGYLGPSNTVVVPRELVSAPYFDSNYPRSIIYGRLGIEIATAIVSSILPYDSSWSRNEGLLSSYHLVGNQSLKVANAPQICLSQFVTRNKFATEEIAQLTSLSTLKHVTALRLADTALRKELEYADHVHQPALEIYEDDALFYISYAQTKCGRYTEQQELLDNSVDFKLSDKILLKVSWSQVPKFATALECTPHSGCSDIL